MSTYRNALGAGFGTGWPHKSSLQRYNEKIMQSNFDFDDNPAKLFDPKLAEQLKAEGMEQAAFSRRKLLDFDGKTYDPLLDRGRLNRQLSIVKGFMLYGGWWTLAEISAQTGEPEASVSARLRDLRKPRFGGFTVERRRRSQGTFEYRVAL